MFYIVFLLEFLSTCETKSSVTFEPNKQFEWGKKHLKEQEILFLNWNTNLKFDVEFLSSPYGPP